MQPNRQKASSDLLFLLEKPFPAIRKARFAKFYDYDNNKYFDFNLSDASVVLGYSSVVLSRALKNTLSRGFLHYAPSHLEHQAKKALSSLFQIPLKVYFFYSLESLMREVKLNLPEIQWDDFDHRQGREGVILGERTLRCDIPAGYRHFIFFSAIANGLSVYTLATESAKKMNEDALSPFHFEAVISTLSEMRKNQPEKRYKKLLKPYQGRINDLGGGIFEIKGFALNAETSKKLLEHGIYTRENQRHFYLCAQTEEHQLQYLMKIVEKLA